LRFSNNDAEGDFRIMMRINSLYLVCHSFRRSGDKLTKLRKIIRENNKARKYLGVKYKKNV